MPTILVAGHDYEVSAVVEALLASDNTPKLHIRSLYLSLPRGYYKELALPEAELMRRGVKVMSGNFDDRSLLLEALRGVDAAFLSTQPVTVRDPAEQVENGRRFVEAAVASGVPHIVYLSGAKPDLTEKEVYSPDDEFAEPLGHQHARGMIEMIIRASGVHWTILRVSTLLHRIPSTRFNRFLHLGVWAALDGTRRSLYISMEDVAKAAVKTLLAPEIHRCKIYTLATAAASVDDLQDIFERIEGDRPARMWFPRWFLQAMFHKEVWETVKDRYNSSAEAGLVMATIAETRALIPDALDIEAWFRARAQNQAGTEVGRTGVIPSEEHTATNGMTKNTTGSCTVWVSTGDHQCTCGRSCLAHYNADSSADQEGSFGLPAYEE